MPASPSRVADRTGSPRWLTGIAIVTVAVAGYAGGGTATTIATRATVDHRCSDLHTRHDPAPSLDEAVRVPLGEKGVTHQTDRDPPSGPSSFALLADGSVVLDIHVALDRSRVLYQLRIDPRGRLGGQGRNQHSSTATTFD